MKVTKLPLGEPAPTDIDCLRIEENGDGSFRLTATALCGDDGESASLLSQRSYASIDEAESAGRAWAESLGSEHLFVSIGTARNPLRLQEMDLPL